VAWLCDSDGSIAGLGGPWFYSPSREAEELLVSMMDCMKLARSLRRDSAAGSQWIIKGWACGVTEKGSGCLGS
jgi:hypothetical protein